MVGEAGVRRWRQAVVPLLVGVGSAVAILPMLNVTDHALAGFVPLIGGGAIAAAVSPLPRSYGAVVIGAIGTALAWAVWYFGSQSAGPYDVLLWLFIPTAIPLGLTVGWLPTALVVRSRRPS